MLVTVERVRAWALFAGFNINDDDGAINDGIETAADLTQELLKFAELVAEDIRKDKQ